MEGSGPSSPPPHALPPPEARGRTREVLHLAWPAVINMISITLLGTADTILMGRVGTEAQAGVGIAMTFLFTVMCFFLGILDMVQTFVARATGRGDAGKAAAYGSAGFHLALLFSIPTALTAFGSDYFFELLGTTPEIIPAASAYFRIRMIGCVFFYLSRTSDAWFRGIGDT
ncbi:MAG: MATE family efflux transporter, partial [Gemmatimonadota bacterium]|nr:MATE family efflux transporter [Gemmatimonadota bacterium]